MSATDNKFLRINPNVILTPIIEPVIVSLEAYFKEANKISYVTSGKRSPESQLTIIRNYLTSKGLASAHPEALGKNCMEKFTHEKYGSIYCWQLGWSKLLNIGVIINPPAAAACLMDYIRNGINKKGLIINGSPHFNGTAFDVGGGPNGIADETEILKRALADRVPGLMNILPERENNANHCDCKPIS
jgi:hypothetical protein